MPTRETCQHAVSLSTNPNDGHGDLTHLFKQHSNFKLTFCQNNDTVSAHLDLSEKYIKFVLGRIMRLEIMCLDKIKYK